MVAWRYPVKIDAGVGLPQLFPSPLHNLLSNDVYLSISWRYYKSYLCFFSAHRGCCEWFDVFVKRRDAPHHCACFTSPPLPVRCGTTPCVYPSFFQKFVYVTVLSNINGRTIQGALFCIATDKAFSLDETNFFDYYCMPYIKLDGSFCNNFIPPYNRPEEKKGHRTLKRNETSVQQTKHSIHN